MLTTNRTITHRHNDEYRNTFLKHNRQNNFLPNLNKTQTKQKHRDMTSRMTMIFEQQLYQKDH